MIEIIWHGRGGQGAFTAAKLLGTAYALKGENSYALAFPSFGPERRGAPVRAFTKLGDSPLGNRCEIKQSDYIIFLDDTLFHEGVLSELKEKGKVLVNTKKQFEDQRILTVDANKIAHEILGVPMANTAMLGALSGICSAIESKALEEAVALSMGEKLVSRNIAVIRGAREVFQ